MNLLGLHITRSNTICSHAPRIAIAVLLGFIAYFQGIAAVFAECESGHGRLLSSLTSPVNRFSSKVSIDVVSYAIPFEPNRMLTKPSGCNSCQGPACRAPSDRETPDLSIPKRPPREERVEFGFSNKSDSFSNHACRFLPKDEQFFCSCVLEVAERPPRHDSVAL